MAAEPDQSTDPEPLDFAVFLNQHVLRSSAAANDGRCHGAVMCVTATNQLRSSAAANDGRCRVRSGSPL